MKNRPKSVISTNSKKDMETAKLNEEQINAINH